MKGRSVVGSLPGVMKGRFVSMDVKRGLRSSIFLLTLTYGSENWTWNGAQQSRVACCREELPERSVWSEQMGRAEHRECV